jgi:hypothetical protein
MAVIMRQADREADQKKARLARRLSRRKLATYYRTMRAMNSELGPYVMSGQMSAAQADRMISGDPEHLRRFLALAASPPSENHVG